MALPAWLLGLAVVRLSSRARALQFICGGAELLGEVMYANLPPSLLKILPSGIWPKTSPGMNHQPPLFCVTHNPLPIPVLLKKRTG